MNSRTVILAALPDETLRIPDFIHLVKYTRVGKINAAMITTKVILELNPNLIINIGSVGVLNPRLLGEAKLVRSVIDRDMNCEPLVPRGQVFSDSFPSEIELSKEGIKVASGDTFLTRTDEWLTINNVDAVDMELFAIAKICSRFEVKCKSIKYGTDLVDKNAGIDWQINVKKFSKSIRALLETEIFSR